MKYFCYPFITNKFDKRTVSWSHHVDALLGLLFNQFYNSTDICKLSSGLIKASSHVFS